MRTGMRLGATIAVLLLACLPNRAGDPIGLVICAPGYPGSSEDAQPTMDAFAAGVGDAAGWPAGAVVASYDPTLEGGLARLRDPRASTALVPLPFFLEYRESLRLRPLLEAVPLGGAEERFSLVARKGSVDGPRSLAGQKVSGLVGYAPGFVRRIVPGAWGELPADAEIRFSKRMMSVLRVLAEGEPGAAVLDSAQAAGLGALPFGSELEIVAVSAPLPASLLCEVDGRLGAERERPLVDAFRGLAGRPGGAALLESLRLASFRSPSSETIDALVRALEPGGDSKLR